LFDAMPEGTLVERAQTQHRAPGDLTVAKVVGDAEIFHVGWPEHLLAIPPQTSQQEADEAHLRFIKELQRRGVKIVWTMHNRRPHNLNNWPAERADRIYRAWAAAVDGVSHHSRVGRDSMLADLPFKAGAVHAVIPHGHFARQLAIPQSRTELEAQFNIKPCAMRFGVLGRWQQEKQIEMMIQAFREAGRADQQLIVTAHNEQTPRPQDDRIIFLSRPVWMSRAEIAQHVNLCDVLISAHSGPRYLTSGIQADALGVGATMLVPEWPFFREVLGDSVFYHDNTLAGLRDLLKRLDVAEIERAKAAVRKLAPTQDWSASAKLTLDLYRAVLAR
jgi:hypothetical protein